MKYSIVFLLSCSTAVNAGQIQLTTTEEFEVSSRVRLAQNEPEQEVYRMEDSFEMDFSEVTSEVDETDESDTQALSYWEQFLKDSRITLKHEVSNQLHDSYPLITDRSSVQLEYSKYFLNDFFIKIDTKANQYWSDDHYAEASDGTTEFDTRTREAYLQYGKGQFSVKLGTQMPIWGESDGGAITDIMSPRNLSELFFVSLEESRVGQAMLGIDLFKVAGNWSFYYVPDAKLNEYPKPGTAYYIDPFQGQADIIADDNDEEEYALRWRNSIGKWGVAVMAASAIDNNPAYRVLGTSDEGTFLVEQEKVRFDMLGATFNYSFGNYLLTGEFAQKQDLAFNNSAMEIVYRDRTEGSVRAEYSLGKQGAHSIALEFVERVLNDWDESIQGREKNEESVIFSWNNNFFNQNLNVSLISVFNEPYSSMQHSLFTSYNWSHRVTLNLDVFYMDVSDERSEYFPMRRKDNVIFKILYQF